MNEEKKNSELKDEELEQVVGGSFFERGHTWSSDPPQRLIVTPYYGCSKYKEIFGYEATGNCGDCFHCVKKGLTFYCKERTYDNDPVDHYFHGNDFAEGRF